MEKYIKEKKFLEKILHNLTISSKYVFFGAPYKAILQNNRKIITILEKKKPFPGKMKALHFFYISL